MMSDSTQLQETPKSILETVITAISAGAAISALLSAIYNWAYFHRLGFVSAEFLTSGDILVSAITWLPAACLGIFVGFVIYLLIEIWVDWLNSRKHPTYDPVAQARNPLSLKKTDGVLAALMLFGTLLTYISSPEFTWVAWDGLGIFWFVIAALVSHAHKRKIFSRNFWLLFYFGPPLVVSALVHGNDDATSVLNGTTQIFELTVVEGGKTHIGKLLRTLDRGVLLWLEKSREIVVIPWDHLDLVRGQRLNLPNESRQCLWFKIGCAPSVPEGMPKTNGGQHAANQNRHSR